MVKRDRLIKGAVIQVTKVPPGQPGPRFQGKLGLHEKLEVVAPPFSEGGLNLVRLKRLKTGEVFEAMYAFCTNFCREPKTKDG